MTQPIEKKERYTAEDYFALPEDAHTELIEGKLYKLYGMAPPSFNHQKLVSEIQWRIISHIKGRGGKCEVMPAPFMVQLKKEKSNYVEPDISVICDPEKLTDRGCVGAPDWIIEIVSPSDPGHDYMLKLNLYQAAGVREYWIVDIRNKCITACRLENGIYVSTAHSFDDEVKAGIFEDFSIDFSAIKGQLRKE